MTLTTFDEKLCRIIEPNVSPSRRRFEVLCRFRELGVPTVIWITPILPFINDTKENIAGILGYCRDAGVRAIVCPRMSVTMRDGNRQYFYKKLDEHFPGMKERYIKEFGEKYELVSPKNDELMRFSYEFCEKNNIIFGWDEPWEFMCEFPSHESEQLSIFDM